MCIFNNYKAARMPRIFVSALLVAATVATGAHAAVLQDVEGQVSVDRGQGFRPAKLGAVLKPGDRIRTINGTVNLVYNNQGCSVGVGPGSLVVVSSEQQACQANNRENSPNSASGVDPILAGSLIAASGLAVGLAAATSHSP